MHPGSARRGGVGHACLLHPAALGLDLAPSRGFQSFYLFSWRDLAEGLKECKVVVSHP